MRQVLHILTKTNDTLAAQVISKQKEVTDVQVEVIDLAQARPDYKAIVEKIFAADSIQVW